MEGADKRFIIPVYQRNYDWRMEQCRQLFDDLVKIIEQDRKSHFFGSIVSVNNPQGSQYELLIIDGQQRLTTISLLMLAMYNLIQNGEVVPRSSNLGARLYEDYLVDKWQSENNRIKLKPIKKDCIAYEKLFGDEEEAIKNSNLTINYLYFAERIRKNDIKIDDLYTAIGRLEIIDIGLTAEDNPQLIFESLNSTGLDLTEGDKIRNYILMGLSIREQEEYYTHYWNPIEIKTDYDVSGFIRDYLSVKQMETPAMDKVYHKFKEYVENTNDEIETLLADLLIYAKRYHILLHGTKSSRNIHASITRLNQLKTTVIRPFLLEVFREKEEGNISEQDVEAILSVVESYIFRRNICELPTNSLNKIFLQLHKDIFRLEKNTETYLEKMKYIFANKKEKARFPNDKEFLECLGKRNIYSMPSKNKWYLFERLENGDSREVKNVYKMLEEGEYTIEHIMPQHLTPIWKQELGEFWNEVHEEWIHRLANLTLTAYNSKYSNRPFLEKRDMANGFKDSGFRLNQRIACLDKWSEQELQERNRNLKDKALRLWKNVDSLYVPREKVLDSYTLEEDYDFTGQQIAKFRFKGIEQPAISWIDMYQKVLMMLHQEDKSILNYLADCEQEEAELAGHVGRMSSVFSYACMIEENIYVLARTSTQYKISLLKKFFVLFSIEESELTFYLRDEEGMQESSDIPSRFEIRMRFWETALPSIQEKTGLFQNVTPTKENWVSGATGKGGIHYSAVANMSGAKAELYIGTSDKEKNKHIYDILFSKREEIEASFGGELQWTRMNDKIASRIFTTLDHVSIGNENDWDEMADFLADRLMRLKIAIQGTLDNI